MSNNRLVRIGGAAGYWGDSVYAAAQLVERGDIDYLVFDYLAEVTMSILARARERDASMGYAPDFIELVLKPLLPQIVQRRIRVVANCGGVNVAGCAQALRRAADEAGVELAIGTVEGDDILTQLDDADTIREMFTAAPLPGQLISANAYLGALPIASALDAGADIVITGRCVDSAVTLGPLIHEFGWSADDYDRLASGTLAGHIIECGAQATGGNFTDWRDVADGWHDMGYPIAECRADGSFAIGKPPGTGGLVSPLSVGEQILYEIGDPAAYQMPDVCCDFSNVQLIQDGPDRVAVRGARGRPPGERYKVSATYRDGYRACSQIAIVGFDAAAKARACADAFFSRTRRLFRERGLADYDATAVHVIGAETMWAEPQAADTREVVLQIEVRHRDRSALEIFSRETNGVGLSMSTGRCAVGEAGRPRISPVIAQFAFLYDKRDVAVSVALDGRRVDCRTAVSTDTALPPDQSAPPEPPAAPDGETRPLPLLALAVARSGDKGDLANIGVIARDAECHAVLSRELTGDRVARWFSHLTLGDVRRYELAGFHAFNFLLCETLDGGGTSSLHLDKQAKTYAQILLTMPIDVPRSLADRLGHSAARGDYL